MLLLQAQARPKSDCASQPAGGSSMQAPQQASAAHQ